MALEVGHTIEGKYRVVRRIGEGGMGAVYEGENIRIKRRVAIKVLHAPLAKDPAVIKRFEREAQAAAQIGSKHIVDVIDLGDLPDGELFMVMEFLEGENLDARIQRKGTVPPGELFPIALQLLDGLEQAHQAGIIHRDLKPDNVFITREHKAGALFVKILDFGISKFRELDGDHKMTRTGAIMGTPYFLSPEQARGNTTIDERVDLYAVGVILYYGLSGRVPFESPTFNDLLFKIALEDPPPIESVCPALPPGVGAIVRKAMARDRTQRYQTAGELARAIRDWLHAHTSQQLSDTAILEDTMPHDEPARPAVRPTVVTPPTLLDPVRPAPMITAAGLSMSQPAIPKKPIAAFVGLGAVGVLLVAGIGVVLLRGADAESAPAAPASGEPIRDEVAPAEPPVAQPPVEQSPVEQPSVAEASASASSSAAPRATPVVAVPKPPPVKPAPPPPPPVAPPKPAKTPDGRIITPGL